MRALNYWEQFLNTGKIGDYLSYRDNLSCDKKEISCQEKQSRKEEKKEGGSEGFNQCYRDDPENRACWRI